MLTGKDISDDVLNDMDKMTQEVIKGAKKRYDDTYDDEMGIAEGYGLDLKKKLPRLKGGGQGQPGALPPGWVPANPKNPLGL